MTKSIIIAVQFLIILILGGMLLSEHHSILNIATSTSTSVVKNRKNNLSSYTIDKNAKLTYEIVPAEDNTWGYMIFINGRIMLIQRSKPGLPGNAGFITKENAKKVAELVIDKMRKGTMPPSVTFDEMVKLGVTE